MLSSLLAKKVLVFYLLALAYAKEILKRENEMLPKK
jgi:hypothetical protein